MRREDTGLVRKGYKATNCSIRIKFNTYSLPCPPYSRERQWSRWRQRLGRGRRVTSRSSQTRKGWDLRHRRCLAFKGKRISHVVFRT